METKPIVLDLFCGGGGAGAGYIAAGFDVIGIDIARHKNYPGTFIQADVFSFDYSTIQFDAIHASPPCQNYTVSTAPYRLAGKTYPDLVATTRSLLNSFSKPYIIENVPAAPLFNPITLCGTQFGLKVIRHRKFESNFLLFQPAHKNHLDGIGNNGFVTVAGKGNCAKSVWLEAMGIHHRMTMKEIAESIPPVYTEYLGNQLLNAITTGCNAL